MKFKAYKYVCEFLNEPVKNAVPRVNQFEEWHRHFNWDNPKGTHQWTITEVFDVPKPNPKKGFYKTIIIPVKCNKADYEYLMQCNKWSADVWNYCVEQDKLYQEQTDKLMKRNELQLLVKGYTPLHSAGNQHPFIKYYTARQAMFSSMKIKHENSNKVKLPYKQKKFFNTGWNNNCLSIDYENGIIKLARAKDGNYNQKQVYCYAKTIPQHIVEIELIYRNGLKLAIKHQEPNINIPIESNNSASIDLGEIHAITSIDNNGNAIIITGRKLRSIKRFRNKEQAKLKSKMSKCTKGSRQYQKYNCALHSLSYKVDKQILDCIHKITKLYVNYCLVNNISTVYYGDLDSCTRNTRGRVGKKVAQKLNQWEYGQIMLQLHNKLERYGIKLVKISEAYSSQKCPYCRKRNKPTNRNYECKHCGYTQHRDIVGAINILNDNDKTSIIRYQNKKYLQIT